MAGIVAMWVGIMEIARASGLVERMTKAMKPLLRFLFPEIPGEHKAMEFISANMIANFLGLGWAATPFWTEGNGGIGQAGGGTKAGQSFGDCQKKGHCKQ